MFCHKNSPVAGSGEGAVFSPRRTNSDRSLRQHADAGADVLAALGVVGGQGGHGVRPQLGANGGRAVEFRGADPEAFRISADLVERHQAGVPVEVAVLDGFGGHRAAQLLEACRGLRVGECGRQNLQRRSRFRFGGDCGGHRRAEHLRQHPVVAAVYPDGGQQRGDRGRQAGMTGAGGVLDRSAQSGEFARERVDGRVDLQLAQRLLGIPVVASSRFDQRGERVGPGRVDEHPADLAQRVVARGAVDREGGVQRLADGEDLLDDDPGLRPGEFTQPGEVAGRVGQPVGMVHSQPVDQSLGEPASHLGVAGVEDLRILLAQARQRGHREEPAVAAYPGSPPDQLVVLAVMNRRRVAAIGARRDREVHAVVAQHIAVDGQLRHVGVRAQHRKHDPALFVGRPVDVEEPRVARIPAVPQYIPPPRIMLGQANSRVVGDDVDDQTQAAVMCGRGQRGHTVGAAQFGRHRGRVGDVVAVRRTGLCGQDGGQVEVGDAEIVEVVEGFLGVGEGEGVTAHLQAVG
jgi:hypothetical protein